MSEATELVIRVPPGHRNHHLWNNNGTWFVHNTLHLADYSKFRVGESPGTCSLTEARRRRGGVLAGLWNAGDGRQKTLCNWQDIGCLYMLTRRQEATEGEECQWYIRESCWFRGIIQFSGERTGGV